MESHDAVLLLEEAQKTNRLLAELIDLLKPRERRKKEPAENGAVLPELARIWNDLIPTNGPFRKVMQVPSGGKRGGAVRARWDEKPDPQYWALVFQKVRDSNFCRGKNDRKWVASFDWVMKPDTAAKVLEGTYDNKGAAAPARRFLDL